MSFSLAQLIYKIIAFVLASIFCCNSAVFAQQAQKTNDQIAGGGSKQIFLGEIETKKL